MQTIVISINNIKSINSIVLKIEKFSKDNFELENNFGLNNTQEKLNNQTCNLKFENVNFNINSQTIINNFNFEFKSGKKYLIIGMNGSGKSSIFKVLKKWYRLSTGDIYINNKNINIMFGNEISRYISYINENVSLFSGSIRDNSSLYRHYDDNDLELVKTQAKLKLDLDKNIIDEGRNISSGEQRKIEIARSLLKYVPCIVFDEVISTLDIESAFEIEKMVLSFDNKTIIVVSHNFSGKLVNKYDEILIMHSGKLVDHGTFDELIERNEYFNKICDIKFGDITKNFLK